ncbi:carboxymuconolactone decarboxylase family protein [Roseiconus lacunae]|uniref:carboxymuconolactone decarboxylase family protein n=1 Tax=Roseiconus lacunae TaxID=2605694 RepID=UPI0028F41E9A|nr:carboxymuconolactone decarboxylase family protein [Roseiconus lacunae]
MNGSSVCLDMHTREDRKGTESDHRLFALAVWREAPCFSDSERAALALAEAVTRMSDRTNPVPDEIWNESARRFDEQALATLILKIGMVEFGNRVNATTKQIVGECGCE